MQIDSRLNEIDDCLYRVAARVLIVQNDKVLLVQETPEMWWAFPGGGVDHGETIESTLVREIQEELGMPVKKISSDFRIAYYDIGSIVNGVPRMNLYYRASLPEELLKKTNHVAKWKWFTKDEFFKLELNPSYDKAKMVKVIFDD
jgi:8-oxo-dGTP pyrophosphatase MutT (NUDIX family)